MNVMCTELSVRHIFKPLEMGTDLIFAFGTTSVSLCSQIFPGIIYVGSDYVCYMAK